MRETYYYHIIANALTIFGQLSFDQVLYRYNEHDFILFMSSKFTSRLCIDLLK